MSERPVLKRPPTRRRAAIRALVEQRGEIGRAELLEWARAQGIAGRNDAGARRVTETLYALRENGIIEYDRQTVRTARNPDDGKNLSRKKRTRNEISESGSKALVALVFQAFSNWRACHETNDFRHEGLAR